MAVSPVSVLLPAVEFLLNTFYTSLNRSQLIYSQISVHVPRGLGEDTLGVLGGVEFEAHPSL